MNLNDKSVKIAGKTYIINADIENLKSLHTLFDKHWSHMLVEFEQIVWSEIYKIFSFLAKKVNDF